MRRECSGRSRPVTAAATVSPVERAIAASRVARSSATDVDYVEQPKQRFRSEQVKRGFTCAVLNIIVDSTYNRTCPFPSIRLKQALMAGGWDGRVGV